MISFRHCTDRKGKRHCTPETICPTIGMQTPSARRGYGGDAVYALIQDILPMAQPGAVGRVPRKGHGEHTGAALRRFFVLPSVDVRIDKRSRRWVQ